MKKKPQPSWGQGQDDFLSHYPAADQMGLLYGIVLCTARALGEFGAVSAMSKLRGETFTLPLEIDALYQSGSTDAITAAFAVSSLLVLLAVGVLLLRVFFEAKLHKPS